MLFFPLLVYRSADGPRPQSGTTQVSTLRIKSETGEMVIENLRWDSLFINSHFAMIAQK